MLLLPLLLILSIFSKYLPSTSSTSTSERGTRLLLLLLLLLVLVPSKYLPPTVLWWYGMLCCLRCEMEKRYQQHAIHHHHDMIRDMLSAGLTASLIVFSAGMRPDLRFIPLSSGQRQHCYCLNHMSSDSSLLP